MAEPTVNDPPPAFGATFDDETMARMEKGAQGIERGQQRRCALVAMARDSQTLLSLANNSPDAFEEFATMVLDFHDFAKAQLEVAEAAVARIVVIEDMRAAA